MKETFFREYTSQHAILKYSKATAGSGISYLLEHDYKNVYLSAFGLLPAEVRAQPLRVLEFGCGAGMNLMHLTFLLSQEGLRVDRAIGTDFSPVLIDTARREAKRYVQNGELNKIEFHVAKTESLLTDLMTELKCNQSDLEGSFQFILGVNTIRYCHAANKEMDGVRELFRLLAPGGICVIIDMNNRFPLFRSELKNRFRWKKRLECYIPSLEEYTAPFSKIGFHIIRQGHFCWIPHSAGGFGLGIMKALSPLLNVVAHSRAMRSLVIAAKPVTILTRS